MHSNIEDDIRLASGLVIDRLPALPDASVDGTAVVAANAAGVETLHDSTIDSSVMSLDTRLEAGLIYAIEPIVEPSVPAVGKAGKASGGRLHWYRHLGLEDGTYRWHGPRTVGTGWGELLHVFPGGDGIIYAVDRVVEGVVPMVGKATPTTGGRLYWYRHMGRADGTFEWQGPNIVARGWGDFTHVFYGGDGIIYAVERVLEGLVPAVGKATAASGGRLLWFRHVGRTDGTSRWEGPRVVGRGWGEFVRVFSGGDGIVYAVEPKVEASVPLQGKATRPSGGHLLWYRHIGRDEGTFRWEGPRTVGDGWADLEHVFAGDGVIYAVDPIVEASVPMVGKATAQSGGDLYWYRHLGRQDGSYRWQGPKKVGDGWGALVHVFSGRDGSPAPPKALHAGRICDFMDPAGSPTVGIRAYGLKSGHGRGTQLAYSVTGSVPGANLAQLVQAACNVWAAATAQAPGTSPALSLTQTNGGGADIAIAVGSLPASTSGRQTPDGTSITISSTFAFSPANPVVPGTCSLLATIIHEVGHALGLLHSTSPISVMNPANCALETLAADDVAAIRALYAWPGQRSIPNVGTDSSPALCACGSSLVMAWKGIGETNLWVSRSDHGVNWTPQARVFGAASTDGPALAWDGSKLWMAFTGIAGDNNLYWTACSDSSADFAQAFSKVLPVPDTGSSIGPAMTIFNGWPLLVWRGIGGDTGLYYSTYGPGGWAAQNLVGGVGSTTGRPCASTSMACREWSGGASPVTMRSTRPRSWASSGSRRIACAGSWPATVRRVLRASVMPVPPSVRTSPSPHQDNHPSPPAEATPVTSISSGAVWKVTIRSISPRGRPEARAKAPWNGARRRSSKAWPHPTDRRSHYSGDASTLCGRATVAITRSGQRRCRTFHFMKTTACPSSSALRFRW